MKTNKEFREEALAKLKGNWKPAVIASLLYVGVALVGSLISSVGEDSVILALLGLAFQFAILLPFTMGLSNAYRLLLNNSDTKIAENSIAIAKDNYKHNLLGMFFMAGKTILWMLLFIIPGIIMSYAYALTPYILKDNPEIEPMEASARSREMMKGHKMDLFLLHLSFIGWIVLSILTCGIGSLWVSPYIYTAQASFYENLKAESVA